MKSHYVYSTLSSDVIYQNTVPGGADIPRVVAEVLIKGGAGIANDRLVTPRGVVTSVTEQQLEALRLNPVFEMHEKNGFIQVSDHSVNADTAAADMVGRDQSAPVVPQDLPVDGQPMGSDDEPEVPQRGGKKRR